MLRGDLDGLPWINAQSVTDHGQQLIQIHGFGQIIHGAEFQRIHCPAHVGIGSDQEKGQGGVVPSTATQQVQSVLAGHAHIADDHGRCFLGDQPQSFFRAFSLAHGKSSVTKDTGIELSIHAFVVNDDDVVTHVPPRRVLCRKWS